MTGQIITTDYTNYDNKSDIHYCNSGAYNIVLLLRISCENKKRWFKDLMSFFVKLHQSKFLDYSPEKFEMDEVTFEKRKEQENILRRKLIAYVTLFTNER